ncbi:MAG TPA: SH3 domain-containing protein [Chloroflexia bacterium]|nr:SH3 domain-containing protein [Chloroflexia bacterium]
MTLPIKGTSAVARDACKQLVLKRNPIAPLEVIDAYYDLESTWGIRADLLASQMFLETDYLRSWWSQPPRRNMAGIGVTGEKSGQDPHTDAWAFKPEENTWYKGYSFPDWHSAVQAHFAHMSAYVYPDEHNNASHLDPRYSAARSQFAAKNWPPVEVLTDLNGKWAVPGTTYGQSIENVYNAMASLQTSPHQDTPPPDSHNEASTSQVHSEFTPEGGSNASLDLPQAASSNNTSSEGNGQVPADLLKIPATLSINADNVKTFLGSAVVATDGVVVRSHPDPTSESLRSVDKGTVVNLVAYTDSGTDAGAGKVWYLIEAAEGGGWIYSAAFGS